MLNQTKFAKAYGQEHGYEQWPDKEIGISFQTLEGWCQEMRQIQPDTIPTEN